VKRHSQWASANLRGAGSYLRKVSSALILGVLAASAALAAADGQLQLPNFDGLAEKATQSVDITLDSNLLGLAARFLDPSDPADAQVRSLIGGIKGIYVRSYTFDKDFAYPSADVDLMRKQLTAPGWQRLVQVQSRKEQTHVDIYISTHAGKADGLAIIASEPRKFTIVNIVGAIDLEKLRLLEGHLGVPKLTLPPPGKPDG
jgi:hypothetical protein